MTFLSGSSKIIAFNTYFEPKAADFVDLVQHDGRKTRMFRAETSFEVNKVNSLAHSVRVRNDSSARERVTTMAKAMKKAAAKKKKPMKATAKKRATKRTTKRRR